MGIFDEQNADRLNRLLAGQNLELQAAKEQLARANEEVRRESTARQRAEESLREGEHRYRSLYEGMLHGFAHCEMLFENGEPSDFVYLDVNRAFEKLTGLKDVVGRRVTELIPGIRESTPELFSMYARVAKSGVPERFEIYVNELGIWFSISAFSPQEGHFVALFDNITERKHAEEALRKSEQRFSLAFHSSPIPTSISEVGTDRLVDVNEQFLRTFGYTREEVVGKTSADLAMWADRDERDRVVAAIWGTGAFKEGDARIRTRSGEVREVLGSAVRIELGSVSCVLTTFYDVTERRALEAQLRQAQKMDAVGRLAGGIAHDFNNLLTAILGYAELATERLKPDDPSRAELSEIDKAAHRAADLTRQLLAFSRKQVLQPRVIDLNQVVSGTHKMLRRLIGEDIAIVTSLKEGLGSVNADTGQIEQVLVNLAVNSRDAMPKGGKLTIETSEVELDETVSTFHFEVPPGRYVMLAVSDTGTGMDQKTLSHVFEPFFTTKGVGKGTGLGLSTVYGVVKQSGGHVTVYSEPGIGTTIKIYLPRVEDRPEKARDSSEMRQAGGTETVLVVEDEDAVRRLSCRSLEAHGYVTLPAANASEALLVCEKHSGEIHLMLTDVVMPRMSGKELAQRAVALRPRMKVLFMSGYTDDAILQHGVLDAGTAFLQKPFTPRSLAQKVRDVLDAGEGTGG